MIHFNLSQKTDFWCLSWQFIISKVGSENGNYGYYYTAQTVWFVNWNFQHRQMQTFQTGRGQKRVQRLPPEIFRNFNSFNMQFESILSRIITKSARPFFLFPPFLPSFPLPFSFLLFSGERGGGAYTPNAPPFDPLMFHTDTGKKTAKYLSHRVHLFMLRVATLKI